MIVSLTIVYKKTVFEKKQCSMNSTSLRSHKISQNDDLPSIGVKNQLTMSIECLKIVKQHIQVNGSDAVSTKRGTYKRSYIYRLAK